MPKISVILSVKKREHLQDAVKSILKQTYRNFELIIINDSSKKIIVPSDARIKIVNNKTNLGLTKSLNIGIKRSRGEFIARMDADDISKPERLKTQLGFLEKNPKIALIGSWVDFIDEKGSFLRIKKLPTDFKTIKNNLIKANQFYHPTLFIRKKILDIVGYYDEKFTYSQDYELVLRIASKYPVKNLPESLIFYRVNAPKAISYNFLKDQAKYALRARLKALKSYNYPKWQIIHLVKPLISFLTPKPLLIFIYNKLYFNHEA